jgi:subtilisin family serine protease
MTRPARATLLLAVVATAFAVSGREPVAQTAEAGADLDAALRKEPRVHVIVKLREPEVRASSLSRHIEAVRGRQEAVLAGLEVEDFRPSYRWSAVSGLAGELTEDGLAKLLRDPDVERVDLDVSGTAGLAESVPLIRADEVHDMGVTGKGVVVAVLDTGIDSNHSDLKDSIVAQQCFCTTAGGAGCCPGGQTQQSGSGAAKDDQGHGTNVAGIIAGRGRVASVGVAPGSKILAVKVLDSTGAFASSDQVISGLDYIISQRPDVKVVNMSLGTSMLFSGTCDNAAAYTSAFAQAINTLKARGTSVFASSLNNGSSSQTGLPACIAAAISVGAVYDSNIGAISFGCTDPTTKADQVCCFSNSSSAVDLLAPGAAISAAGRGGGISTFLGTSQASPHAAGAAALLLEVRPGLTVDQIEGALKSTGVPIADKKNGLRIPRIDVRAALDAVKGL